MEINATNEARSTENTTKNQTTFRLGLHLSTAHGDPASDTYADFNFAGSTPDEFDHALATILDVVTSTVYGGQLNGLQEIIDRSTAELRSDSEKAQHGAATLEDILRQEPPEDDAQQPKPKRNPLGSAVYIEGVGLRYVQDTGSAVKGKALDVAVDTHSEALTWSGYGTHRVWLLEVE